MEMKTYLADKSREQKEDLALRVETSVAYLGQIASGHRKAGLIIALRIQRETNKEVTVEDLAGMAC